MSEVMGINSSRFGNTSVGSDVDEVDESLSSSSLNIALNSSRVSTSPEAEQLSTRFLKLSMRSSDSVGIKSPNRLIYWLCPFFVLVHLEREVQVSRVKPYPTQYHLQHEGKQTRPGRTGHDQPLTHGKRKREKFCYLINRE